AGRSKPPWSASLKSVFSNFNPPLSVLFSSRIALHSTPLLFLLALKTHCLLMQINELKILMADLKNMKSASK
ncbi:MAG: hypothetical protein WAU99_09070, partial [Pseudolabrys sp.]